MWQRVDLETAFERDEAQWRANRNWRSVADEDSTLSVVDWIQTLTRQNLMARNVEREINRELPLTAPCCAAGRAIVTMQRESETLLEKPKEQWRQTTTSKKNRGLEMPAEQ